MENRASYIFVGAFVLIFVAATIGMAVWLAGVDFDEAPKQYTINFEGDVTGLSVGSPVRYRGVPVGSVSAIDIAPENVERVKVIIDVSRDTPIKTDTVAQLALQGITGVAFVQLTGGTHAAPVLAPDRKNKAPVIASRPSALQQLVNRLPEIVEKVDRISGSLVKLFDDKNIAALSSTLENIERASSMMGKESDQISSLLREGRAAIEAMKTAGQSISVLARTLDRETKPLSSDLSASLKEFRHTMTTLRQGIGTLDRVAGDIASVVDNSKGPLQDFTNSGLYEFSTFFSEARILVDSMTRLVDRMERDPAQFFFGDSQRGVKAQ
jgi:phospholipid/cholesterol/gamma-HCH transport system substrate-binding protein